MPAIPFKSLIGELCFTRSQTHAVLVFVLLLFTLGSQSIAASLEVRVVDRSGAPVPSVVVNVSDGRAAVANSTESSMSMDQMNMRFLPQVLVVPQGGSVRFPNSDAVSHQVYSFSKAKTFQSSLYKGSTYPPVVFDKPGLVVVGCNIHDEMVGYIYVTAARWYGQTDAEGKISWNEVSAAPLTVSVWGPLVADAEATLTKKVDATSGAAQVVEFKLSKTLRSNPQPRPRQANWNY